MAKIKEPVTTKSDDRTRMYILGLMESLPKELFALVTELRDISAVIRNKADTLDQDVHVLSRDLGKLAARLDALEQIVKELCDTASKATAIGPLWSVMQEKQVDPSERKDD